MSDWNLGLDPTPGTGTDPNEATNKLNFHNHSGIGKGEPIDSQYVINTPAGDITADNTQAAIAQLNDLANLGRIHVPVRQTVLIGLTDSNDGIPIFLVAGSGLSVSILAASTPLIIAFAYSFSKFGQVDFVESIEADVPSAWSALPANQTCYLYIDRNIETGVLSYGYSLFAPVYQNLAPETPSTDQHWFDLNTFYMKRWNGTAWDVKQRVFVGECTTNADSVTSVVCYAIQGKYDSGWFTVSVDQEIAKSCNVDGDYLIWGYMRDSEGHKEILIDHFSYNSPSSIGAMLTKLNKTIYLRTGKQSLAQYLDGSTTYPYAFTTGQARVFAKRIF